MKKQIFNYTPADLQTGHASVNDEDGKVTLEVRSPLLPMTAERRHQLKDWLKDAGSEQPHAFIELPLPELVKLHAQLTVHLSEAVSTLPTEEGMLLLGQLTDQIAILMTRLRHMQGSN